MTKVAEADRRRGSDWFTPSELAAIVNPVRNEGYPPAGRTGVGAALRKASA
jgi:hypothetical protein